MMKFIGKSVLIEDEKRILVIGDLHLGRERGENEASGIVNREIYAGIVEDFEKIFRKVKKKVDEIVILGDIKHNFSNEGFRDRYDLTNLLDYLLRKSNKLILIRGNHDNFIKNMTKNIKNLEVLDYYIYEKYCFLHGDRDFISIYDEKIKYWVMGHLHPVISFTDENKRESYKCILRGHYNNKEIIILPSFINIIQGLDVTKNINEKLNLAWKFQIKEFKVLIVEGEEVLDFGKLSKIKIN